MLSRISFSRAEFWYLIAIADFFSSQPDHLVNKFSQILIKFYLSIEKRQQSKRFNERQTDPLKLWKLSPNDLRMADKWEIFSFFKEQMFSNTSYEESPWVVINANNKMVARLTALRYLLNEIEYDNKKLSKPKSWNTAIHNYKVSYKGVDFPGLSYKQYKTLQRLVDIHKKS